MERLPRHVAIIMDGNGRWAKKRLMPRGYGHKKGLERMEKLISHAFDLGIEALTLYALSTENMNRPEEELENLFSLFREFFGGFFKKLIDNGVKLIISGDISVFPDDIRQALAESMEKTKDAKEHILNIALNYGSRQEIVRAVNIAVERGEKVTTESFSSLLYTAELPELDLLIRTGKEIRLSNFLLYQASYAELYFTNTLFPDFTNAHFDKALEDYAGRNRRFGKV